MNTSTRTPLALLCVLLSTAACSDSDSPAQGAAPDADSGISNGPGSDAVAPGNGAGSNSESDGGLDAGPPNERLPDNTPTNVVDGGGSPSAPACDPTNTWSNSDSIAELASTSPQQLLAVTGDELSLAWLEEDELWIADRDSQTAPFDTPQAFSPPAGYDITRGAALSPDGLRLVVVEDGGRGFAQATRDARGEPFEAPIALDGGPQLDAAPFEPLHQWAEPTGHRFEAPVLHQSDNTLLFAWFRMSGDMVSTAQVVAAGGTAQRYVQDETSLLSPDVFGRTDGERFFPTGLSHDALTLFVWDDATEAASVSYRERPGDLFYSVEPLGDFQGATPNDDCSRLYFSRDGALHVASAPTP